MVTQRNFSILVIVFFVLAGTFYATSLSSRKAEKSEATTLLSNVPIAEIKKVKLERGAAKVTLVKKGDVWRVGERSSYPADSGKVRSFLLKLFELESSQKVTKNVDNHARLGVNEAAIKNGAGRVSFLNDSDEGIGAIYFGEFRKPTKERSPRLTGQYVRRAESDVVYLLGQHFSINIQIANWLDKDLANTLSNNVWSITQKVKDGEGYKKEFALSSSVSDNLRTFKLLAKGNPNKAAVSEIDSGLEGLRLEDVYKKDSKEVEGLSFNKETVFKLTNGLSYSIKSAEQGERYFGKISVEYDAELVEALKKEHEEVLASFKEEEEAVRPELELATEDDAQKLSAQYEEWVYVFPTYIGKKFRKNLSDMIEKTEED